MTVSAYRNVDSEWTYHFVRTIEEGQLVVEYATVCFRSQVDCGPYCGIPPVTVIFMWSSRSIAALSRDAIYTAIGFIPIRAEMLASTASSETPWKS